MPTINAPGFWRSAWSALKQPTILSKGDSTFRMAGAKRLGDELAVLQKNPLYTQALEAQAAGKALTTEQKAFVDHVNQVSNSQAGIFAGRVGRYGGMGAAGLGTLYAGNQMLKSSSELTELQKLGQGGWRYMLPNVANYEAGKAQAMHQMNPEAMGADAPWTVRHPMMAATIPGALGAAGTAYAANKLTEGMSPTAQALATILAGGGGYFAGQGLFNYLVNKPRIEASKARFAQVGANPELIKQRLREVAGKNRLFRGVKGAMSPTWAQYDRGYSDMLRSAAYGQPDTPNAKGAPVDVLEATQAALPTLPLVGALRRGIGGAGGWGSINTARQTLGEFGVKE